jgi:hypothetical protein
MSGSIASGVVVFCLCFYKLFLQEFFLGYKLCLFISWFALPCEIGNFETIFGLKLCEELNANKAWVPWNWED